MMSIRKKITEDPFLANTLILSFLAMALALQALVLIVWIYSFIPIKPSPLTATLFPRPLALVLPEREMFFYHLFIGMAIGFQIAGMMILKTPLLARSFTGQLLKFTIAEYGWSFLIVFAVFKMFVYGMAPWTKIFFYFSLIASALSKVFWKEIQIFSSRALQYWDGHQNDTKAHWLCEGIFVLFIFLVIYIPDQQGLLAKMFITDHFHHFDTMIMSAAWGYLKGAVLDVDQFTHYAIGLPIVMARLALVFGGFNYETVVKVLCLGSIIYYAGVYALARYWLKSIPLAMSAVILLIKWQMFNPGVAPIIFNYPSASIWRYPLDILILFLILSHLRGGKNYLLTIAAVLCGFSAFYMIDTGVYLSLAFIFYVGSAVVLDIQTAPLFEIRIKVLKALGVIMLVPAAALFCLYLTQGQYLFDGVFWSNLSERSALFLMGHGDLPMYKSLLDGKYLESWMGFFIPWVYMIVVVAAAALLFLKRVSREYLFLLTLTVYGLGLYHYYIVRSADTSYDVVVLPFVFILAFIIQKAIRQDHPYRKPLLGGVLAVSLFALLTNHYFLNYPNFLQLSQNPITQPFVPIKLDDGLGFFNHNDVLISEGIKLQRNSLGETEEELKTEKDFVDDSQLKSFFNQEFDFSQDASLIAHLTRKEQGVPLISSFETKILMQADRKPFFYYFPLTDSRPMHMRIFPFTSLWTTTRLSKTLKQLEEAKPTYVFMEKILMAQSVPASYQYLTPEMLVMLQYIHQNYILYKEGHFLVALKHK